MSVGEGRHGGQAEASFVADPFGTDLLERVEQPVDIVGDDRAGVGDGEAGLAGYRDRGHLDGPVPISE